MSSERVLITGGAGFIGAALAESLLESGRSVMVLDSLHPQVHTERGRPRRLPSGVTFVPFNVTDSSGWDALLKTYTPEMVVHLAAETGTGQSLREASRHALVNVLGTTEMLDSFSRNDLVPPHVLLSSSRAVYGEGRWRDGDQEYYPPVRSHEALVRGEWDPPAPSGGVGTPLPSRAAVTRPEPCNIYGATKLAQEQVLKAWCAAMGCSLSVLRLQNVYGVGQSLTNPYTGVLSLFAAKVARGEELDVFEDGVITRDFVYIDDVVKAMIRAIDRPPEGARVIDIGSGTPVTILQVAEQLSKLAGAPTPHVSGHFRDGDVRAAWCDLQDAREELDFQPTWSLADGLRALLASVTGR